MRINIVPLVPEVESQPAAPKKHWTPNHQLEITHKFGWVKGFAIGLWLGQHFEDVTGQDLTPNLPLSTREYLLMDTDKQSERVIEGQPEKHELSNHKERQLF